MRLHHVILGAIWIFVRPIGILHCSDGNGAPDTAAKRSPVAWHGWVRLWSRFQTLPMCEARSVGAGIASILPLGRPGSIHGAPARLTYW